MNQKNIEKLAVSLISGDDGLDRIAVHLVGVVGSDINPLTLTPHQARMLATELITAVNRAEVKKSLQTSSNLWRRQGEASSRLASA